MNWDFIEAERQVAHGLISWMMAPWAGERFRPESVESDPSEAEVEAEPVAAAGS